MKHKVVVDNYFGVEVEDRYRWLEDDNAPDVKEWVQANNEATEAFLSKIPFRAKIKARLEEVWDYEKLFSPFRAGDFYYFFGKSGLQNQGVMFRQKISDTLDLDAELFFDPNTLSEDGTVALNNLSFSKDGKLMAYSVSSSGSDWQEIFVYDTEKKEALKDHLTQIKFSNLSWYKNGFFYSCYDTGSKKNSLTDKNKFQKLKYHIVGTDQSEDITVYEDVNNPLVTFSAATSYDECTLFISIYEGAGSGCILLTADLKSGLPKSTNDCIQYNTTPSEQVFPVAVVNNEIYLMTNKSAPLFKLLKVAKSNPVESKAVEVLPEKDCVLESCYICACDKNDSTGKILATYVKDVQSEVYTYDLSGKNESKVDIHPNGSVSVSGVEKNSKKLFISYTSYTVPTTLLIYDILENKLKKFFSPDVGFNIDDFESKQVFFTSKDGTKVPMHIVYKKGMELNGNNPTLLYAYGGFSFAVTPAFSTTRVAFLEAGGIFACANIRGGLEYGEKWHEDGMKMKKQNVFDDFISAAEYLIEHKYTSPKKLAVQGASNGGLLIGAVVNQRPDLFAVAIPQVGVMDMLRYQHFTIGWAWVEEYGSSEESKEMFEYLYAYSPLHNVKAGIDYPSIMVTTADHDDRVVPAHSFKYTQALHDNYKGENPILIRIEEKAGHGAGKPTTKVIEETADIFAFILYQTNSEYKIK